MKQQTTALKTMGIKARVYNQIRTELYKKKLEEFTPAQKVEFFNKIFSLNQEAHQELNAYKAKRQYKAHIASERVKRGVKPRKKTSLKEYLENQK